MAEKSTITADYLRSILDYDMVSGAFTWRIRPVDHFKTRRACSIFNTRDAGNVAGSATKDGYHKITIDGRHYLAHRLAWLYITGDWPEDEIDHADTTASNNIWLNIRQASRSQNCANVRTRKDSTSRLKGVHWCKRDRKWIARVQQNKRRIIVGYFDNPEDAYRAYCITSKNLFGQFSRTS